MYVVGILRYFEETRNVSKMLLDSFRNVKAVFVQPRLSFLNLQWQDLGCNGARNPASPKESMGLSVLGNE